MPRRRLSGKTVVRPLSERVRLPDRQRYPTLLEIRQAATACYVRFLMEMTGGSVKESAKVAGLSRQHFMSLIPKDVPRRGYRKNRGNEAWRAMQ